MLLSGFTIIRNGIQFDFPFLESIQSALPICDEFIINIGVSEDTTKQVIESWIQTLPKNEAQKIKCFESIWPLNDEAKRKGGRILADQTNLALEKCKGQWCLYLQADELLHEKELAGIRQTLENEPKTTQGLVFGYYHFYGTYNVIQTSRSSYRREIRIIRNGLNIQSTGDAQSFRHSDGSKIQARLTPFHIFHYGWVRPQQKMKEKTNFMDSLYHGGKASEQTEPATGNNYLYKRIVGLRQFKDTHPQLMQKRIQSATTFDFAKAPFVFHFKDIWKVVSGWIERLTGYRPFEFKNYRLVK